MITFFRKLFKRGDFMTRADKWYYSKVIKTWLWSAFAFVIIAWVGTNLVLCALSTNVKNNWDIIYTPEPPAKNVYLPTGDDFHYKYLCLGAENDWTIESLTLDYYTSDGVYTGGGSKNLIENITPEHIVDGIDLYRANSGKTIYVLSKDNMVANKDCGVMFGRLWELKELYLNNFDESNIENMEEMFAFTGASSHAEFMKFDLSSWDTSNVTNMRYMFEDCPCSLKISNWDISNVRDMTLMFEGYDGDTELDLSGWDTSNVTNMDEMFYYCWKLTTIYVSEKFVTTNATTSRMFYGCTSLKGGAGTTYDENHIDGTYARIDGGSSSSTPGYFTDGTRTLPIGNTFLAKLKNTGFLVENTTITSIVFDRFSAANTYYGDGNTNLIAGLSGEVLADGIYLYRANGGSTIYILSDRLICGNSNCINFFYNIVNLQSVVFNNFSTMKVTDFAGFFQNCKSLKEVDISTFDFSKATRIEQLFDGCNSLQTIVVNRNISFPNVNNSQNMFRNCTNLKGENGTTWSSSKPIDATYAQIDDPENGKPGYFTAK